MVDKNLRRGYWAGGIIVAIVIVIGFLQEQDISSPFGEQEEIEIFLQPRYINEGQYDEIDISITIPNIKEQEISFLTLSKRDIIIDRPEKNEQTEVAKNIRWSESHNTDYVLRYEEDRTIPDKPNLTATGKLWGCPNCFMGKESPYEFTLTFQYKKNDDTLTSYTTNVIVPIR